MDVLQLITLFFAVFGAFCMVIFIAVTIKDKIETKKIEKQHTMVREIQNQIHIHEQQYHSNTEETATTERN